MDREELLRIWHEACERVKTYQNIDPSQVDAFFARLQPQAASEGFLMLTSDTPFIKTWIEQHYAGYIKAALEEIHGIPYVVVIEVDPTQQPAPAEPKQAAAPATPALVSPRQSSPDTKTAAPIAHEVRPAAQPFGRTAETRSPDRRPGTAPHQTAGTEKEAAEAPFDDHDGEDEIIAPVNPDGSAAGSLTFENYVIGDSNRMAYSMAVAVAEAPGKANLNPLFIYGKSGLGKTHLLRAIQNYIMANMPQLSTVYVDSAELLNDYTEAAAAHDKEKSSYKNFKNRYEEADVLLIDDVQYFQGKSRTLDIVFQIFNKLTSQGKQVVLSADRAPKSIDIDERYQSRFNSGGTFEVTAPEVETKLGIVKTFIQAQKGLNGEPAFDIPQDIQMFIAESSGSNVRELKSAVISVIGQMTTFNRSEITLNEVRKLLDNHFSGGPARRLTVENVQSAVEEYYRVSHTDLIGKKRPRNLNHARQVCMYLCRQMIDIPYDAIGKQFNRDHATVMYSVSTIEKKLKENRELVEEIEGLKKLIREA